VSSIASRIGSVRERIGAAAARSGRAGEEVRLVAVTKGVDVARIEQAIAAGVTDIGENRVQEARSKRAVISAPVRWHMLGHVQTNKSTAVASIFDVVHSIDSLRVMDALAHRRATDHEPITALIEVELTGLPRRTGAHVDDVEALVLAASSPGGLQVVGLMTIAPPADAPEASRVYFQRLRSVRDRVERLTGHPLPQLSMGMSDDFEVGVEEGATLVRVGRAIFGERD